MSDSMTIDWDYYKERRQAIEEKGARDCLEAVLLRKERGEAELTEWAIAFAEYFEEHPKEWSEVSPSLRRFKFKDKIRNFLDLFRALPHRSGK